MATLLQRMKKTDPRRNVSLRFLGIAVALGLSVGLLISDYLSWQRAHEWTLTRFEVTSSQTLCQLQYKSGKSWYDEALVACADAKANIAARPEDETWRSVERVFHNIVLLPERTPVAAPVPELRLSAEPLALHDTAAFLTAPGFDPAQPDMRLVERQRSNGDNWLSASIYGSSLMFFALMEWLHRRRKR